MEDFFLLVFHKRLDFAGPTVDASTIDWGEGAGENEEGYFYPNPNSSHTTHAKVAYHTATPSEYAAWTSAMSMNPAYSGYSDYSHYQQQQQRSPYGASHAYTPSYASSFPMGSHPYSSMTRPTHESLSAAAGYRGMVSGSGYGYAGHVDASSAPYRHADFRTAAQYAQLPVQSHVPWSSSSSSSSSSSRVPYPVTSKESRHPDGLTDMQSSPAPELTENPSSALNINASESAMTPAVGQSSEVQEFLAAVTQLLGDELFQVFLGELKSLRLLIQNKKLMFANKVSNFRSHTMQKFVQ